MYGTGLGPGGTVWDQGGIRMRVGLGQSSPPALSGVADGCYGPAILAGVFAAAAFARRQGRGRAPRTYALWARISGGPGQTDMGRSKKVARRA